MILEKLLEIESAQEFEDVNAIRRSRIHSFLDEWVVTDLLGRGSFGNVYKIVKPQPGIKNQECALKICQVNNPEDAELISQEIKMQMALSGHPNAVQVEDYALISREPPRVSYLLIRMELLSPLPAEGLSERETIQLGIDICSVLEKCASMEPKLVHCDIKPANILVSPDGRYKLGDFGTAKTLQATMTYTGNRGTPMYMAPEVASYTGYDSRCDIFSLGYTMLTMLNGGRHPYETAGDRSDVLRAMYETKKPPHIKGVSSGLLKIIRKMCEPNLHARYSRASEVKRDLELFVRKKAEAEKLARLEAERQAELARKKAKAEREKSLRLAQNAVDKAESELAQARAALESAELKDKRSAKKCVRVCSAALDRAVRVSQYVADGASYDAALKAVRDEDAASAQKRRADFVKANKNVWFAGAAVWVVLVAAAVAVTIVTNNSSNTEKNFSEDMSSPVDAYESEQNSVNKSENDISGDLNNSASSFEQNDSPVFSNISSVETYEGFVLEPTDDMRGYKVADYTGDDTEIVIPAQCNGVPVIEIGEKAFSECSEISSVFLPGSIRKIGSSAFYWCRSLANINLPNSISSIDHDAFEWCSSLKTIEIPDSINYISNGLFWCCTSLTQIKIPDSVVSIGSGAFGCCTSLKEIQIPDSVSLIGVSAFYDCSNLIEIILPDTITSIEDYTFDGCSNLKKITIPNKVYTIGEYTFRNCSSLSRIMIPDNVTSIGKSAFNGCMNLAEVTISNQISTISDSAFKGCTSLKKVMIPSSVTIINNNAFGGCVNLSEITLPNKISSIGLNAFWGCRNLNEISIPKSTTFIGSRAFSGCTNLTIYAPKSPDYYGTNLGDYKEWITQ